MKTIFNISRLHQQELLTILKMLPNDPMDQYITTGYKIINPDDEPGPGPMPMPIPRDVTVEEYNIELAAWQAKHMMDPMAPQIQILETYNKENVLDPVLVDNIKIIDANTVPPNMTTYGCDLIVVGLSDAGVNIFKKCGGDVRPGGEIETPEYSQLQKLSDARDAGIPIIFTHDCLEVNSFTEPFPDDYEDLIGNFGVDNWSADYGEEGNQINHIECSDQAHVLMNNYFELSDELDVQSTHNGGLTLKAGAKICFEEAARTSGKSNYYLATYEEVGKGKVVLIGMGHCGGNFNQFFRPSINECKILANAIVWCLTD